jgi:hypothetical protein
MNNSLSEHALFAALLLGGAIVSASAGAADLAPTAPRMAKFGAISTLTYYTVEKDGFRVVTTIQLDDAPGSGLAATPIRFVVTLIPGQETMLSVPREAGMDAIELKISRVGDVISVVRPGERAALAN